MLWGIRRFQSKNKHSKMLMADLGGEKSNVIVRFDRYKEVAEAVKGQNLLSQIQSGVKIRVIR